MGRRCGCVGCKSWPAPSSSWLVCMEVYGVNCGSSEFCRHSSMSQTVTWPELSDKYLSQRQHFQDWLLHISVSLSNVLLRTLNAVGPIPGCQPPHCGSAVGVLAHVILRAFWLPFHSLPFASSFVPFLLGCHRNVFQHFWGGCQLFSLLLFPCCHSYGLEPTNLLLFFRRVLTTGVRLTPTLSLPLGGVLRWDTQNQTD